MAYSRQAEALMLSFSQFDQSFSPETVCEVLREQGNHIMADLIESLCDQLATTRRENARLKRQLERPRKRRK